MRQIYRPELFVRNEAGELALHPTWKSVTTDWANPAYQQYMVDLVLHDQREYGNDGYRVDAATYKGAGWNPAVSYPAYRDGSAAPDLMWAMLTAMRRKNPEAVLLSEVFGPVFYSVCNFAHDFGFRSRRVFFTHLTSFYSYRLSSYLTGRFQPIKG